MQDSVQQPPVQKIPQQPLIAQVGDPQQSSQGGSQSSLISKLRSSMNPGTQSIMLGMSGGSVQNSPVVSPPPMPSQPSDLDVLDEVLSEIEEQPQPEVLVEPTSQPPTNQVSQLPIDPTTNSQPLDINSDPSVIAQALPTAVTQVTTQQDYANLNPPTVARPGSSSKEKSESSSLDAGAVEAAQAIQYVEHEPQPEIPPEVDGFLKRAQDHSSQAPQEIVVADGTTDTPTENTRPSQPVVVLPITEETEKKAAHKSTKFSIKWLVEWSHKIMKKFVGKVIYRE